MFSYESEDERMTMKMKRQEVRNRGGRGGGRVQTLEQDARLRTRILLTLVATNIFDSFVRKRDLSIRDSGATRRGSIKGARSASVE